MNVVEQLKRIAESLSRRQKIVIASAAVVLLAGFGFFLRWRDDRDFAVLYSKLAPEDASAVVTKLKETASEYRLSDDGTVIRVRTSRVADLRLQMASAGIPKTGRIGFELFDKTNLGLTEFAEQVNYNRALEGELERTIMTIAEVEHARVHISPQKDSVFLDHRRPAKASVLLKLRADQQLAAKNVHAVTRMVASAVEGLAPEAVTILDVHGTLLNQQKKDGEEESEINKARIDYRRNVERDLLAKVNSTLEPLLGPDRFRAAVSVEVDYSTADQSEESFDPARSVMTQSQRTEEQGGGAQPSGTPGAPTNLPRPTARPGVLGSGPTVRRQENINYQTSRLVKRTHIPHGTVRRLSVGVLLDYHVKWEGEGAKAKRVAVPPPPEQLKAARDIVSGAVGFEADRGDLLVVESLPFEQTLSLVNQPPAAQAPVNGNWFVDGIQKKDPKVLGILAAAILIPAAAGFFLWKRRKRAAALAEAVTQLPAAGEPTEAAPAVEGGQTPAALSAPEGGDQPALAEGEAEGIVDTFESRHDAAMADRMRQEVEMERQILDQIQSNLKLPSASSKKSEVLAKHLQDEGKKNPERLAQIVRTWMTEGE